MKLCSTVQQKAAPSAISNLFSLLSTQCSCGAWLCGFELLLAGAWATFEIPQVIESCKEMHDCQKHGDLSQVSPEPEATPRSGLREEQALKGGNTFRNRKVTGAPTSTFTQTHTPGSHAWPPAPVLLLKRGWLGASGPEHPSF